MNAEESSEETTQTASESHGLGGEILRRFGHSLRTPLNEIAGNARLMLGDGLNSEQRRNLARIEDAADEILDVLNDLLDVAELESGKLSVQTVPFRLPDVVREAVRSQRKHADERQIALSVHGLAALPTDLHGDPGRIRQVLGHLISDAVRSVSAGSVQIAAQLVDHSPTSAMVRFGVRRPADLTPELKRDVEFPLEGFSVAARTDSLGLAIAAKIVSALGGRLAATLGDAGETILEFTLDLARGRVSDEVPETDPVNRWVAVIADEPVTGGDLVESLTVGGFAPTLYESVPLAATAIAMSDDTASIPGVVVLAPSTKPFDVAKRAVVSPVLRRSRMIIVVPHGERGDGEESTQLGLDGYFAQPLGSVDLIDGVRTVVGRRSDGPLITRHSLRERRRQLKILVADDSPTGRAVVMRSLELLGHTTSGATNGREAVDALRSDRFDAVLMDMEMPELDGVEATRMIRSLSTPVSDIPIIGLSAHAFSVDREACLEAGMDEHFTKPFRIERLHVAMERLVTN